MRFFRRLLPKPPMQAVKREIRQMVTRAIETEIDKRLPIIIEDILRDRFANRPNDDLSEIGFNWALALSLRAHWPEISNQEAVRWLMEYINVPHGHPDYDWSPAAAKLIASEYVNELGEVT